MTPRLIKKRPVEPPGGWGNSPCCLRLNLRPENARRRLGYDNGRMFVYLFEFKASLKKMDIRLDDKKHFSLFFALFSGTFG